MDNQKKTNYYMSQIWTKMAEIEHLTGSLFETNYRDLDDSIWENMNLKNVSKLMYFNNQLGKIIENLAEKG